METITITRQQARRFILAHQNLWPHYENEGKSGILNYIRRVGCIQFDPLNIVGYNHELVLQSRISNYHPSMLYQLLYNEHKLLDGWDKNMSIYCTEDWPYFKRNREAARQNLGNSSRPVAAVITQVVKELEERGPLSSADLHFKTAVDWAWAPTTLSRAALESMYFWGELIIHHKVGTRKVYDFASRHIPSNLLDAPDPNHTSEQYYDWYVLRRIGSIGLLWNKSGDAWLGISGLKSEERNGAFKRLVESQKIIEVCVEGLKHALYMRSEDKPLFDKLMEKKRTPVRAAIIAPLDNLLWERQLVREIFDFEYRWEVYKPLNERKYGYYVLPVLYGDTFVARFEPGRDKKSGALIIKNWWWEPGIKRSVKMYTDLLHCFKKFIGYLGTDTVRIDDALIEREGLGWLIFNPK